MLRLWTVVWAANVVGTLLFALLVMQSSALSPSIADELSRLGATAASGGFEANFWSGILAGAARSEWEHSVPATTRLRYSITLRTLRRAATTSAPR